MTNSPPRTLTIFGVTAPAAEWTLLALTVALTLVLALRIDVETAKGAIQLFGYWQMWLLIVAGAVFLWCDFRRDRAVWRRWSRRARRMRLAVTIGCLLAVAGFAHVHFTHGFKILSDEATLANTSRALQQHRLVYTPGTAEYRNGIFIVSDGFMDKRPYFHAFAVSLLHSVTGYRWNNSVWLNAGLTPLVFLAFFCLGRRVNRRWGGGLAVGLAAGVPIFAQTLTGGGFEPLNLLMLLTTMLAALRCWDRWSLPRFGLFLVSAVLLGHTRYESGLYLLPAGVVAWLALRRGAMGRIPWVLYFAPMFCVPLLWLQRIAFSLEHQYFQLAVHDDPSAFAMAFLRRNLAAAWEFFFVPSSVWLSAPAIAVAGILGSAGLMVAIWKRARSVSAARRRAEWVMALFGTATFANVVLFLFFAYGDYTAYITQRISVPVFGSLIVGAVWLPSVWSSRIGYRLAAGLAAANLWLTYLPAANGEFSAKEYLNGKDFAFMEEFARSLGKDEGIFVYTHNSPGWMSLERPCMAHRTAEPNPTQVLKVLSTGQYNRILIHVYEYSPFVTVSDSAMNTPPVWFNRIEKKLLARRWLAQGIWVAVYEMVQPIGFAHWGDAKLTDQSAVPAKAEVLPTPATPPAPKVEATHGP